MEENNKLKNVFLSGALSLLYPGLGQVYCGFFAKGLICFVIFGMAYQIAIGYKNYIFLPVLLVAYVFVVYDAVKSAQRVNKAQSGPRKNLFLDIISFFVVGIVCVFLFARASFTLFPPQSVRDSQAKTAAMVDIITNIPTGLELYKRAYGAYPTTEQGLKALCETPAKGPVPAHWRGRYLERRALLDPWGHLYHYLYPGIHNKEGYDLYSYGTDGIESADDIVNWE